MSLPNYLAKIKSSGIYRFVFDKSEVPPQVAETLRLVVGYSEKGPFNTPVYIDNTADFITIFGNISKKLERKGIYFHRLAIQALAGGPILALNLKPFKDESNKCLQFNPSKIYVLSDADLKDIKVKDVYDTNRFWFLNQDALPAKLREANAEYGLTPGYISLSSTDVLDKSCTVFIRKYTPSDYALTIREWYANNTDAEMPTYLNGILDETLNEYFAEAFVFRGEFNKTICGEGGPFGNRTEDGTWNGMFKVEGDDISINADYVNIYGETTDALLALASSPNSNFVARYQGCLLPYFKDANGKYISLDLLFNTGNNAHGMLMKFDETYLEDADAADVKDELAPKVWGGLYKATMSSAQGNKLTIEKLSVVDAATTPKPEAWQVAFIGDHNIDDELYAIKYTYGEGLYAIYTFSQITQHAQHSGKDFAMFDINSRLVPEGSNIPAALYIELGASPVEDPMKTLVQANWQEVSQIYALSGDTLSKYTPTYPDASIELINSGMSSLKQDGELYVFAGNNPSDYANMQKADYPAGEAPVRPLYFAGYTYSTINTKDSFENIQKAIFAMLKDKGLRTALTNSVDVEYHYIVDTFKTRIMQEAKAELATIAKEKDNAFAILNFPPMADFVADPDYISNVTGKFDITKVNAGTAGKFTLPAEINGASWCAFYTNLVFSDGTLKETIPSAAVVSNNFMEKYSSRQPYYVVAGPTYGRISYSGLVGPDYNYGRDDLDVLEPMGVNAIIYVPRKGTYINSNQTAKQVPVSALSKVHIRELVIYLQNEIESMLQNYQWELNTQTLRDTIKAKADTILENVQYNGGVYAFTNTCDETNNTAEVIDNEMIILDTAIEPARAAGKMVQRLTIHRTGGITSTNA